MRYVFCSRAPRLEFATRGETIAVREKGSVVAPVPPRSVGSSKSSQTDSSTQLLRIAQVNDSAPRGCRAGLGTGCGQQRATRRDHRHGKQTRRTIEGRAGVGHCSDGRCAHNDRRYAFEDYVARVPGLVLSNVSFANGPNQLTIRGITTGFGGNPTVGVATSTIRRLAAARVSARIKSPIWIPPIWLASKSCAVRKERCTAPAVWVAC